jgi:hypothetical protein
MRMTRKHTLPRLCLIILVSVSLPNLVHAQSTGNKAVWGSSGLTTSTAWVDVSAFCGSGGSSNCGSAGVDFCTVLSNALASAPSGAVLDARGVIPNKTNSPNLICGSNPFSSLQGSSPNTAPFTVLLPGSTILLSVPWVLPANTRLVGEVGGTLLEDCPPNSGACTSFSGPFLIRMGSTSGNVCPSAGCSGISIERVHLSLYNGSGNSFGGIQNVNATQSSYVKDVAMSNLTLTGLSVLANGSGPYTDLNFTTAVSGCGTGGPPAAVCVDLEAQTQGLRDVTCIGNSNTVSSNSGLHIGIIVNGSNNSLKDIHIESFNDGIAIGTPSSTPSAIGNVSISNVTGTASGSLNSCHVTNTVHICGPNTKSACPGTGTQPTVSNVTVMQAVNIDAPVGGLPTILDDVTGTVIASCGSTCSQPVTSAIYMLGGNEVGGGSVNFYPLFASTPADTSTSSTPVPTWGVGNVATPGQCFVQGALYSNTTASAGAKSVYVCTYVHAQLMWQPI